MQELTFETMIAVFEEIFGRWLFWLMVAAAAIVTLLYIYVLIRDRAVSWHKFLWAQVSMPVGAALAVLIVWWATRSGLRDIGGPIDLIVLLGVAAIGAVGAAILVYTVQSLVWPPQNRRETRRSAATGRPAQVR